MSMWKSQLVERGLRVASRAHAGQFRKGSETPYVVHPVGVAMLLMQYGLGNEHVLAAALLHDVVEDTHVTLDDLKREFPQELVRWIELLTERKFDESGTRIPWEERKREHLARLRSAPVEVKGIALADKLHNLMSIEIDVQEGRDPWRLFNAPRERVLEQSRRVVTQLAEGELTLATLAELCHRVVFRLESVG